MRKEIEEIAEYIRGESGHTGPLDPEADLLQAKILDSFSIIQLAMFIQERFEVELEAEDLTRENLASLAAMVALIDRRKAAAG